MAALAALAVGVVLVAQRGSTGPSVGTPSGHTREKASNGIFTYPKGLSAAPLVVVFGGLTSVSYATREAMESAAPEGLKDRVSMFFVNTKSMPVAAAVSAGRNLAQQRGVAVTDVKVLGFSAGGDDVQRGFDPSFSFVGLIDPSTNARYAGLPFNRGTRMIYNVANWAAKYASITQAMPVVGAAINRAGGKAQSVGVSHKQMVPKFFEMYAAELAAPRGDA